MRSGIIRSITALSLGLLVTGCAVGQKISYHDVAPELTASGTGKVAVAAEDNRPYVKDKEKDSDYVGNLRGGFGNPFNLGTESGKPLAEDMSSVICDSFRKKGFGCQTVAVAPGEAKGDVTKKLKATNADKLLLLTVDQWYSSTYQNTSLEYNVDLNVMDRSGSTLAAKQLKGEDDLGGSAWNPPGYAKEALPKAYKSKLEMLLNDPAVANALK